MSTTNTEFDQSPTKQQFDRPHVISGTNVVLGIFLFAIVMAGGLGFYSYFHAKPFRPLQRAIHVAYPKSYPRVEGGQHKMHRDTPRILRVTMRVEFDPEATDERPRVDALIARLAELAREQLDLSNFEVFEVHLVQMRPEQKAHKLTVTQDISKPQ